MIPQLDMNNFLVTGLFVMLFFLTFIYMVRIVFVQPIEEYVREYRTQLNILKLQKMMYVRRKDFAEEERHRLETSMKEVVNQTQSSLIEEMKKSLSEYEENLLDNFNISINNLYDSLSRRYNKQTVVEEISHLLGQKQGGKNDYH